MKELFTYFLFFIIFSFLGWLLEVICKLIEDQRFINRGFLIGPICPIYGFGSLLMQLTLNKYLNDPWTLFIMIILTCSILEYSTSFILEKIFHTRWWDYSRRRFNINGRICLETMIPFGIFGLVLMYVINPFILKALKLLPYSLLIFLGLIIFIIFITDCLFSFQAIYSIQKVSKEVQSKIWLQKDNTEKITRLVQKRIEKSSIALNKRLIHAFPHLEFLRRKRK